ncbi:MAG: methyltransferase domain-containing protein, partial [Luteimonas sp.]
QFIQAEPASRVGLIQALDTYRSTPQAAVTQTQRGEEMTDSSYDREPRYAKYLSRIIRPFPNFDFFFIKGVRDKAVEALQLRLGSRVLDLGCGSGGSFPYLVKAVGATGTVVGVDISPQSCINARRRVKSNGWRNVEVFEAPAEKVELTGVYDGALMFAAPDVFASETALAHILPRLKNHARVAIFGGKLSDSRWGKLLNPLLQGVSRKFSPHTPVPDQAPWLLLGKQFEEFQIQQYFFGLMFLAYGTIRQPAEVSNNSFKPNPLRGSA